MGLMAGAIVISGITLSFGLFGRGHAKSEYFTETIQRGPIHTSVDATGTLQTLVTVQVGSQVSGQIEALYADYNSRVKRGQLLAKIDPRNFEAQLQDSRANLAAAQAHEQSLFAGLTTQEATLESAKANLEAARVDRDNSAMVLQRNIALNKDGLVAQNDLDTVKAAADSAAAKYQQATAAVQVAQAQVSAAKAELEQAKAQVLQAEADLNSKEINLAYTNIYSPVDGVVVSRNVDVGQTVAASLQAPLLFVIANDLTKMQVNASVDEADIGRLSRDSDVRFTVDAYPNKQFSGTIGEIRLNPQSVQNVVTYSVIINVDNHTLELRPGMTANITFTVASRADALKLPNAALRYHPTGAAQQALLAKLRPAASVSSGTNSNPSMEPQRSAAVDKPDNAEQKRHRESAIDPGEAPGQLWNPADKIQFKDPHVRTAHAAVVWILDQAGNPMPERVMLGITDGSDTEVLSGGLSEGDRVIVADASAGSTPSDRPVGMPLGFGAGRGGRK